MSLFGLGKETPIPPLTKINQLEPKTARRICLGSLQDENDVLRNVFKRKTGNLLHLQHKPCFVFVCFSDWYSTKAELVIIYIVKQKISPL